MLFFDASVRPLLQVAPWRRLECESLAPRHFHMKSVCHLSIGVALTVTDMNEDWWVGAYAPAAATRTLSIAAPGLQLHETEALRIVDESLRDGACIGTLVPLEGTSSSTSPPKHANLRVSVRAVVEVIGGHHVVLSLPFDLFHVSSTQSGANEESKVMGCMKDFLLDPIMYQHALLEQAVSSLIAAGRLSLDDVVGSVRQLRMGHDCPTSCSLCSTYPPSSTTANAVHETLRERYLARGLEAPRSSRGAATAPSKIMSVADAETPLADRSESDFPNRTDAVYDRRRPRDDQALPLPIAVELHTVDAADAKKKKIRKILGR